MGQDNTKGLFSNVTTTSVMALTIIGLGFTLLFCVLLLPTHIDSATRTQIISMDGSIMLLAATYYFGASKQHAVTQQADTITNQPSPTDAGNPTTTTTGINS